MKRQPMICTSREKKLEKIVGHRNILFLLFCWEQRSRWKWTNNVQVEISHWHCKRGTVMTTDRNRWYTWVGRPHTHTTTSRPLLFRRNDSTMGKRFWQFNWPPVGFRLLSSSVSPSIKWGHITMHAMAWHIIYCTLYVCLYLPVRRHRILH